MENVFSLKNISKKKRHRRGRKGGFGRGRCSKARCKSFDGTLVNGIINQEYIIKAIETNNQEMKDFLFTLGCYEGETITILSILSNQYVVVVKDARYCIDKNLASCIII